MTNVNHRLPLVIFTIVTITLQSCTSWAPKRTREDINYVYSPPEYTFTPDNEPTCDELRAIWRMTKRAAQQSILTNQVADPGVNFGYLVKSPSLMDIKPARVAKTRPKHSYGKVVVHQPGQVKSGAAFDQVAETLKNGASRNPGPVVYAPLDPDYDYNGPIKEYPDENNMAGWGDDVRTPGSYGTYKVSPNDGFRVESNSCDDVATKNCRTDDDCDCYDLYICINGRCRSKTINGKVKYNVWEDNFSLHDYKNARPLMPSDIVSNQKSKDSRRKSLRRTDRKKVGLNSNYYSQNNYNKWT